MLRDYMCMYTTASCGGWSENLLDNRMKTLPEKKVEKAPKKKVPSPKWPQILYRFFFKLLGKNRCSPPFTNAHKMTTVTNILLREVLATAILSLYDGLFLWFHVNFFSKAILG